MFKTMTSAIDAKKTPTEDEIEKMTLFYKRDTYPFIKIEEYFKILEMEFEKKEFEEIKNNTLTSIEKKEIVGTYYTDGNNTKNLFITPVNNKIKEIKELYEENNIKMPITISIGNHKGGANKSTTVVNLASSLARRAWASDVSGYEPMLKIFSLPLKRNFIRQCIPPEGVTSRYMPFSSEYLVFFSNGLIFLT